MDQLTNIIIARLKDIRTLSSSRPDQTHQYNSTQLHVETVLSSFSCNQMKKWQHAFRQRETQRLLEEIHLIEKLQSQSLALEEVAKVVVGVLNLYDVEFIKKNAQNIQKLKKKLALDDEGSHEMLCSLLSGFLLEESNQKFVSILKELSQSKQKTQTYDFMLWLGEWSKIVFSQAISQSCFQMFLQRFKDANKKESRAFWSQKYKTNTQDMQNTHQNLMYSTLTGRPLKTEKSTSVRPSSCNPSRFVFFSREYLYSFIKKEIGEVYTLFGDCLDIDQQYLRRIAKMPKQIELRGQIKNMTEFLVRNGGNSQIMESIGRYRQEWREKVPGFKEKQLQRQREKLLLIKQQEALDKSEAQSKKIKTSNSFYEGKSKQFTQISSKKVNRQVFMSKKTQNLRQTQQKQKYTPAKTSSSFLDRSLRASKMRTSQAFKPQRSETLQHTNPNKKQTFELNFIKKREKAQRRQLLKQMNSTFAACSGHQNRKEQSSLTFNDFELAHPKAKEKQQSSRVFVMDCRGEMFFNDTTAHSRMNRQQLRLKFKKSAILIAREALLMGASKKQ